MLQGHWTGAVASHGVTFCDRIWDMVHVFFHWAMTDIRQDVSSGCIRGDPVYADTSEWSPRLRLSILTTPSEIVFLVLKTLRFILLSNFRICNAGITNYRPQAACHIPGTYLFYNHKLIPLDRFTHFTHSPAFGSLLSVLSVSGSIGWFFRFRMEVRADGIGFSLCDLPHFIIFKYKLKRRFLGWKECIA